MGDQYPAYCSHCVDKDKPNTDFLCASNGYPPFWPHSYPNCFRPDDGVEISIGGKVTPAPEVVKVDLEAEVKALAGDANIIDELLASEGVEEEIDDAEDDEELYGVDVPEEEDNQPIKAHADVDAKGLYYCTECKHNHQYSSKTGQDHLEFAGDPPQD